MSVFWSSLLAMSSRPVELDVDGPSIEALAREYEAATDRFRGPPASTRRATT